MADTLLFYVSGHGFGHAVRCALVIEAALAMAPNTRVVVRSSAPSWLFPPRAECDLVDVDVGVVQVDGLRLDEEETLRRVEAYLRGFDDLVESEVAWARGQGVRCVVGDIPPLAFAVAARLGVPGVGLANFSWDWIYDAYVVARPAQRWIVERLRALYGEATLLLRLPFSGDLSAFPAVEDVPLVARPSRISREEARRRHGLPADATVVLLSFGGFDYRDIDFDALAKIDEALFLATSGPSGVPNLRVLGRARQYHELVQAADVVVTKPGYGIVADCLACRTRVLYTSRGNFPEYPILVDALERLAPSLFIPQEDLRAGRLRPYLRRLLAMDRPWQPVRMDGAEVAARRLLDLARAGR